uniref:Protein-S-isoprenylcysteine O-methyltransferase n=1 Tax=Canis lupus familiaris TaxID=9615 RepID=A0A8C0S568_CANLF
PLLKKKTKNKKRKLWLLSPSFPQARAFAFARPPGKVSHSAFGKPWCRLSSSPLANVPPRSSARGGQPGHPAGRPAPALRARGRPLGWGPRGAGRGRGPSAGWGCLLADARVRPSARDPGGPRPRPRPRPRRPFAARPGSGGPGGRGRAGRGLPGAGGAGPLPPKPSAGRAARRYRESSREARGCRQRRFPAGGGGGAVRRRGGRVSPGYSRRRRQLVGRPAPWRAARRGLRRAPRRASAWPPSCWAPRCSRCRCSRAPACRAARGWRSTWPDSTRCCCCSTGHRATRYMCSLSLFHYSEYLVTAVNNPKSLSLDSFLLNHSLEYTVAALSSWIEFTLENIFWPELKQITWLSAMGLLMVVFGECLRKAAMFTAGSNFNHVVQNEKSETHTLVTSGVYAWFRHPSYVGWFYWSIGTQVMLCNPICGVGYALTVWRFFRDRTEEEEISLIHFFGEEYLEYKKRVPTGLPFIKGVKVEL